MASLRNLVETAVSGALSAITSANIYAGIDDGDKELPCIICRAVSASEMMKDSGNYEVVVNITTKSLPSDEFDTICESVRALLATDQFVTDCNITGLKVWGVASTESIDWGIDGDAHTETRAIVLACAAHTFPS